MTMQTLWHSGDCAESINSSGAGVNAEDAIFNQLEQ